LNETGSQLTYQPADRPPELRRPEYYPFPCCLGSGESWPAICCLGSSAYQDAHRSPGALIRRSLLRFRARRSRELPFRSMKHGPSAHGTAAERRSDCRAAATGSIILAEHGSLLGESWKIPEKEFPGLQCAWSDLRDHQGQTAPWRAPGCRPGTHGGNAGHRAGHHFWPLLG
jgi:hypothetical protein